MEKVEFYGYRRLGPDSSPKGAIGVNTFEVMADVPEDRHVVIVLPSTVPTGKAHLRVYVEPERGEAAKPRRASLAEWAERNAEPLGNLIRSDDVEGFTGRKQ